MVQGASTCGSSWIFYLIKDNKIYYSELLEFERDLSCIFGAIVKASKSEEIFKFDNECKA